MSEFQVPIVEVDIEPHPNADRLEIAKIGGYQCVVQKDMFHSGGTHVYIPEGAIVPPELLLDLGLEGKLAGPQKNRVKACKLRGVLSQGLLCHIQLAMKHGVNPAIHELDSDVADVLGITKYEPVIPANLSGDVWNAGMARTIKYDVESIKKYPKVLQEGEEVVFTEKIHGTWCMVASMPPELAGVVQGEGPIIVSSKGQAAKGLAIKKPVAPEPQSRMQRWREKYWNLRAELATGWYMFLHKLPGADPEQLRIRADKHMAFIARRMKACENKGVNEGNLYWRAVKENDISPGRVTQMFPSYPIFVLGEVHGAGIQDLDYGSTSNKPGFRVFDVFVGLPAEGRYLNDHELDQACKLMGLERVPVLYRGPFSMEKVREYTSGTETVTGDSKHIREGIVIRPIVERKDSKMGRVQLKSVSEKYLLRKNGTEFN